MKLKNKKTGVTATCIKTNEYNRIVVVGKMKDGSDIVVNGYNSLAELCEDWEDYKEHTFPEVGDFYYWISCYGTIDKSVFTPEESEMQLRIGNVFETREDAELAVEKLKALKRLKDKGFEFCGYEIQNEYMVIKTNFHRPLIGEELDLTLNAADSPNADLDLLFLQEDN